MRDYIRLLKFLKPHMLILFIALTFMTLFSLFEKASLGVVIPFALALTGNVVFDAIMGKGYYSSHHWVAALLLLFSAGIIWFVGSKLKEGSAREVIDTKTQQVILLKKSHTLFWIPLQYFSLVIVVLAVAMLAVG